MRINTLLFVVGMLLPTLATAFPSVERRPTGLSSPPLDFGFSSATTFRYDAVNDRLYHSTGEQLSVIDLRNFALAATSAQPYDISNDDDLTGSIKGVALDTARNRLYATQEGGKLLTYTLDSLATAPTQVTLLTGKTLSFAELDPASGVLYCYNETDRTVVRYDPSTAAATAIALPTSVSFTANAMHFVPNGDSGTLVLSTTISRVLLINAATQAVQQVAVDSLSTKNLLGLAGTSDGTGVYVINATDKSVHRISLTSGTVAATMDLFANSDLTNITVAAVTNPSGTYAFVSGSKGLSVIDTADDSVLDLGSTSTAGEPFSLSGSGPMLATDNGYLFVSYGDIAVVTDNPFVTVTSTAYSGGGTSMGTGGSVTVTFQSDEAGTYTVRAGGTLDGTGTLLTDSSGATSGSIAAATSTSLTLNYNDNSAALAEGTNTLFVFVVDAAGNTGHMAFSVTVDTPPPVVTILSTSFGNERAYLTLDRLSAADLQAYRAYVSTDAATVLTTATVSASVGQSEAGTSPVITVTGLDNGQTYFVAVDVIDTNGNVSASRTTTTQTGVTAILAPQATFGPAGLAGERGCALIAEPTPQRQWTMDGHVGVFHPTTGALKTFLGDCCNITGGFSGGMLWNRRFGIEAGLDVLYSTGLAVSTSTGVASQDTYKLLMLPMRIEATWRAQMRPNQLFVPYVKSGIDLAYFREDDVGTVIQGVKGGLHGGGGLMLWLNNLGDGDLTGGGDNYEDIYLVIDGRYQWLNSFGKAGLDLSGYVGTAGVHVQF